MRHVRAQYVNVGDKVVDPDLDMDLTPVEVVSKETRGDLVELGLISPSNTYHFHKDEILLVQSGA